MLMLSEAYFTDKQAANEQLSAPYQFMYRHYIIMSNGLLELIQCGKVIFGVLLISYNYSIGTRNV